MRVRERCERGKSEFRGGSGGGEREEREREGPNYQLLASFCIALASLRLTNGFKGVDYYR